MPDEEIEKIEDDGSPENYKRLSEAFKQQVKVLEQQLQRYETHGGVRLYYALNRKLNEIAGVLNSNKIEDVLEGDSKEKKFERLRALWTDAEKIVSAVQSIGAMLNLKDDSEEANLRKKVPFVETIAKTRD